MSGGLRHFSCIVLHAFWTHNWAISASVIAPGIVREFATVRHVRSTLTFHILRRPLNVFTSCTRHSHVFPLTLGRIWRAQTLDITATILAAAGAEIPHDYAGFDLLTPISQGLPSPRTVGVSSEYRAMAVVTHTYKLAYFPEEGEGRFWNRIADPNEQTDLFNVTTGPEVAVRDGLLLSLLRWRAQQDPLAFMCKYTTKPAWFSVRGMLLMSAVACCGRKQTPIRTNPAPARRLRRSSTTTRTTSAESTPRSGCRTTPTVSSLPVRALGMRRWRLHLRRAETLLRKLAAAARRRACWRGSRRAARGTSCASCAGEPGRASVPASTFSRLYVPKVSI